MAEFDELEGRWHWWRGVSGLVYARRLRHAPAVVLRGQTVGETQGEITKWEADNSAWTRGEPDD